MTELLGAARVRELLEESGVRPTRSLGQNFVIDPNTIRKVVELAGVRSGDHVIEIGAGTGSLTLGLAAAGARVTALEVDERLINALGSAVSNEPGVTIVHADATAFDLASIEATRLVANLPYNIAARIVLDVLESGSTITDLTVMTQREVGERLAASPGSKVYGLTSVLVAFHATARVAGKVSRNAFFPVPNVDSVIVSIERHQVGRDVPWSDFAPVARAAFAQRRKTLRSTIAGIAGSTAHAEDALHRAGIDPGARAETLDVDAFLRIARALGSR